MYGHVSRIKRNKKSKEQEDGEDKPARRVSSILVTFDDGDGAAFFAVGPH